MLYPGGGYSYTRHPVMGAGDALTELLLMFLVVVSLIAEARGNANTIVALTIWTIALIVEKPISVDHADHFIKEIHPAEEVVRALGAQREAADAMPTPPGRR
jgi:hypothetical protein